MNDAVPVFDLAEWASADARRRGELAAALDAALRLTGILLLRNHGVPAELTGRMRRQGYALMQLPEEQKQQYQVERPYDNGWRGLGALQASAVDGVTMSPDLHEAFHMGPEHRTGNAAFDHAYYPANKWPREIPEFQATATEYTGHMTRVALAMEEVFATVLGLPETYFSERSQRATWTQNVNWYPSLNRVGSVEEGQMRVGPHSDFGTLSLLDRQPGVGGLQVWNERDGWFTPPYIEGTLAVILGDLMNRWTDGRWQALRHRVLAPPASAPDEELVSLVFFFEADPDARIEPLPSPTGGGAGMEPVIAGENILEKVGVTLTPTFS
ncbi:isopenicillin N synthase family dioxygenase [Planosporangium sp. 12N6]|uniref:isopenicillin N synthase family dioxygenase n=1 Tax=Planosporangium spinosum TaxID=3402278 RepID=UPI003CEA3BBF